MKNLLKTLFVRLQNRNVLLSVFSGVMLILTSTGVISVEQTNHINAIVNTVLTALVGIGIVSNPESHIQK